MKTTDKYLHQAITVLTEVAGPSRSSNSQQGQNQDAPSQVAPNTGPTSQGQNQDVPSHSFPPSTVDNSSTSADTGSGKFMKKLIRQVNIKVPVLSTCSSL